jgi:hypothetical protein
MLNIPKLFVSGIRIPNGPYKGYLAQPCICGYSIAGEEELYLVEQDDGSLSFCHKSCIYVPTEEDDD